MPRITVVFGHDRLCSHPRIAQKHKRWVCVIAVQKLRREPCDYTGGCTETEDICTPKPWARLFRFIR